MQSPFSVELERSLQKAAGKRNVMHFKMALAFPLFSQTFAGGEVVTRAVRQRKCSPPLGCISERGTPFYFLLKADESIRAPIRRKPE